MTHVAHIIELTTEINAKRAELKKVQDELRNVGPLGNRYNKLKQRLDEKVINIFPGEEKLFQIFFYSRLPSSNK